MTLSRAILAASFILAGILHFVLAPNYVAIMPHYVPLPALLVQISGIAEILGGIGLLFPQTRQAAAWGIIALLVAVLPANINMALNHENWLGIPPWVLWARVPLQLPLIWWAWLCTRR